jgi:cellulose synthase/poly-beta-1,6-N-acetylglucosamine synthase-like glycosyltransferase
MAETVIQPSENSHFFPPVSVVVPIYNGEKDLPDLLECLRQQTYPRHQVEYLLVDNNSRDRTGEILANAAASSQADPSAIKLYALNQNQIQSSYAARNTGIQSATGQIIAFTDADCRPKPDWLANLIQPFMTETVGIVAGEVVAFTGKTILEKYADRQETLSQKHTLGHAFCPYGQTANLAIRRCIFTEIGLFRPYLTTGGDADICWRILRGTNWQIKFAPLALVEHRHRSTLRQLKNQWRRYGESNRYLHEIHGVELMRELTPRESIYRLSRWLLKELPIATGKTLLRKNTLVDLLKTPIDLICWQARTEGQRTSKLSESALIFPDLSP